MSTPNSTDSDTAPDDRLVAVIDLVAGLEPGLDPTVLEAVVRDVAGARTRQRRLADALSERPNLLLQGRSPAPRVVGDLLIALRKAGAVNTSAPHCTGCGKDLRSIHQRGQDWYCGVCGPHREPCAGCGKTLPVQSRDRHGQGYCHGCRPQDDADPLDIITTVVRGIDAAIPAQIVATAVAAISPRARRRLAWALRERPDLLTGAGAHAPVPTVLTLIDLLSGEGEGNIVRPPCPHCGRTIALAQIHDGLRLCRNCVAKSRAQPCARCGALSEPATRDESGRPLCGWCLSKDPTGHETCLTCGRLRPVHLRTPAGPLCDTCRPQAIMTCGICARTAPCVISTVTGQPWCDACKQRWARCAGCGQVKPIRGGSTTEPLCATCAQPDPAFWRPCPSCGDRAQLSSGPCVRCSLKSRLQQLLSDATGQIRPELRVLAENLGAYEKPATVVRWLDLNKSQSILRDLALDRLPLTHETLDKLPDSRHIQHLRTILVATGALPVRDEHMLRLERWLSATIAARPDPDEQYLLHRYSNWYLIRRLRGRVSTTHTSHSQTVAVQQRVRAALSLLDHLKGRGLTLDSATQPDLDTWLTSEHATRHHETGYFIRWAATHQLTTLSFPSHIWEGPGPIDADTRWEQARRLLHDDALQPEDRVAGLLILLYAQEPATIARLTLEHIDTQNDQVKLRLGPEPVVLPAPLDSLVQALISRRRGRAALGEPGTSPWLFPGGKPGHPISPQQLRARLHHLGIRPAQARTAALFHLATELPAALLARMLGIHISVAVAWQQASAGDWTTYAADVSRRTPQNQRHSDSSNT